MSPDANAASSSIFMISLAILDISTKSSGVNIEPCVNRGMVSPRVQSRRAKLPLPFHVFRVYGAAFFAVAIGLQDKTSDCLQLARLFEVSSPRYPRSSRSHPRWALGYFLGPVPVWSEQC